MATVTDRRRDWDLNDDGEFEGLYVETRQVVVKNGPSAGRTKIVVDYHVGLDDEQVSIFPSTVALRKMREELALRGKPDFEPGERHRITRKGKREGPNGSYYDDDVWFEHAAPKKTAAEMLGIDDAAADERRPDFGSDDDVQFGESAPNAADI